MTSSSIPRIYKVRLARMRVKFITQQIKNVSYILRRYTYDCRFLAAVSQPRRLDSGFSMW
jgi:hypothetical protein